ncbi:hypothetical protein N8Z26_06920 [Burkholderiales bacterium]|nr:hypothetical protein [Burkholderiales bacterium]
MFEIQNVVPAVFIAYYWIGMEMRQFHADSPIYDRPTYVDSPAYLLVISIMIWPWVTFINRHATSQKREFPWFFCMFLIQSLFCIFLYSLSVHYGCPTWLTTIFIICSRSIPLLNLLMGLPTVIGTVIIYLPLAKIFGWHVPERNEV